MRSRNSALLGTFCLLLSAGLPLPAVAQGIWQKGASHEPPASKDAPTSELIVLDSGGSGAGFGNGDIRQNLLTVDFWNPRLGWSAGHGGVFRSEDGGLSWSRMRPAGGWQHLVMTGPREIWILNGDHPGGIGKVRLSHTRDEGTTWEEVLPGQLGAYSDLASTGNSLYVLCSKYPSFVSHDGGATWSKLNFRGTLTSADQICIPGDVPSQSGGHGAIFVLGSLNGVGAAVRSDDGGQTWTPLNVPLTNETPWRDRIFFATSQLGWIGSFDGQCFFTQDGGQTWEARPLPCRKQISAMWFDQMGRGFAAVYNSHIMKLDGLSEALYETADGGKSWKLALSGAKQINAFADLGPGRVWAVGNVPSRVPNDLVVLVTRLPALPPQKTDEPIKPTSPPLKLNR